MGPLGPGRQRQPTLTRLRAGAWKRKVVRVAPPPHSPWGPAAPGSGSGCAVGGSGRTETPRASSCPGLGGGAPTGQRRPFRCCRQSWGRTSEPSSSGGSAGLGGKGSAWLSCVTGSFRGESPCWAALLGCRSRPVGSASPGPRPPVQPSPSGRLRPPACRTLGAAPPGAQLPWGGGVSGRPPRQTLPPAQRRLLPAASRGRGGTGPEGQPGYCGAALGTHCPGPCAWAHWAALPRSLQMGAKVRFLVARGSRLGSGAWIWAPNPPLDVGTVLGPGSWRKPPIHPQGP